MAPGSLRGVLSRCGAVQASSQRDPFMNDKSPRQSMSKKSSMTLKQKRAVTRDKGLSATVSEQIHPTKKK